MLFLKTFLLIALLSLSYTAEAKESSSFILSSPIAFNGGHYPPLYTCDDKNISPKLVWFYAPAKTATFALIMADPDAPAGTFYHWVLYNIPAETGVLDKAVTTLPATTLVGMNSANTMGYFGPCPPKGPEHHYIFTLYALDTQLDLAAGASATAVMAAMQKHILQQTTMTVLYGR